MSALRRTAAVHGLWDVGCRGACAGRGARGGATPRSWPLLMAETGVWAPCVLLAHASSTASSTVDADLMVTDGDRVVVDKKLAAAARYRRLLRITLLRIASTRAMVLSASDVQEIDAARCAVPCS